MRIATWDRIADSADPLSRAHPWKHLLCRRIGHVTVEFEEGESNGLFGPQATYVEVCMRCGRVV